MLKSGGIILNLFDYKLGLLATGIDMESTVSVSSCSNSCLGEGGPLFTCCQFLMQNFYMCKEMHNMYPGSVVLNILVSQLIYLFFLPCRNVQPGKCYWDLIDFSKSFLDWICQASYSVRAFLLLVRRYRACGVDAQRGMGVGGVTVWAAVQGHISGICHPWPVAARSHRAVSCPDVQCGNIRVVLLQGRVNGNAVLLTCCDVAHLFWCQI